MVRRAPNGFLFVNGTPTDCVHLAVTGLLDDLPDLVISGINLGANMGDDTIYSGTVAAATEGYLLGIPSIAISLASKEAMHFETAVAVALELLDCHERQSLGARLLNVNVPDLPRADAQRLPRDETRPSPQGRERRQDDQSARRNRLLGRRRRCRRGRRATAPISTRWKQGYASVTPLQIDLTNHDEMARVGAWFAPDLTIGPVHAHVHHMRCTAAMAMSRGAKCRRGLG